MILITGGLGFVGTHTTRALLDVGESCVLVQRRAATPAALPGLISGEAHGRVVVERADVTDHPALQRIGERHDITGILHLAGAPWPPGPDPIADTRAGSEGLFNVLRAARDWRVARVGVASTIGVYGGVSATGPLREDVLLPLTAGHSIPAAKKVAELLCDQLADATGIEIYNFRIAGVWGPLGRPTSRFFGAPQLVHAAVHGTAPDFSQLYSPPHADNGLDLCYVKDCGRAIALLQTARRLNHRVYNVAGGRATTYRELAAALEKAVPGARFELPEGRDPSGWADDVRLDISRIREDTGYQPAYDTESAAADYVAWLQAGNER